MTPKKIHPQIEHLKLVLRGLGLEFTEEHRFHPIRMWRFDLAVPSHKLAIEYQGHAGLRGGGASGHSTISGLTKDCEKMNQAQSLGWRVLTFTALHFRESERAKNKLASPFDTIQSLLNTN